MVLLRVGLACAAVAPLVFAAACNSGSSSYLQNDGGVAYDGAVIVTPDGAIVVRPQPDGGPCIVATSIPTSDVPPYAPVMQQKSCSSAQIAAFSGACFGSTSSPGSCTSFFSDAGACGNCLLPLDGGAPNSGAVLVDSTGLDIVSVNTPGCIALADPTNGPACARQLEPLFLCETQACGSPDCQASPAATYTECLTASQSGACSAEYANASVCNVEYLDGGAAVGACASATQVLSVICGM
jgi:hypothetical protein